MTRHATHLFIIIVSIAISQATFAKDNLNLIQLNDSFKKIKLNSLLYIYHDKERDFDGPSKKLFDSLKLNDSITINELHSTGNLWMSFKLRNLEMKSIKHILYMDSALTGFFSIYLIDKNEKIINIEKTGSGIRPKDRSQKSHLTTAEIRLSPKQEITVLIKRTSNYMFNGNVTLMSFEEFLDLERSDTVFFSLYLGATLALILYNFFVFFYSKNILYLSYVEFTLSLSILLLIIFGGYDLFFLNFLGLNLSEHVTFFTSLMLLAAVNFCRVLFGEKYLTKSVMGIFKPLVFITFLSMSFHLTPIWGDSIAVSFNYFYDILIIVVVCLILNCSFHAYKLGHPLAKHYLTSWCCILFAVITWYSLYAGMNIDFVSPKFLILFGSFAEMLIIAFSFAYKINYLDKIESEAKFLAAEKERYKTLLRVIIHDLSNNISSMYHYSLSLYKNSIKNDTSESYFKPLESSYQNIIGIIENIKQDEDDSYMKNPPALASLALSRLDLADVFSTSLATFKEEITAKCLDVESAISEDARFIIGEKYSLVNNVFNNLLSNAIKLSAEGGTIKIKTSATGLNRVAIKLQYSGIRISKEKVNDILNMNIIDSNLGTFGEVGSGNSLKIAQSFLKLQNGLLEIKSSIEEGNSETTFTIFLPTK